MFIIISLYFIAIISLSYMIYIILYLPYGILDQEITQLMRKEWFHGKYFPGLGDKNNFHTETRWNG